MFIIKPELTKCNNCRWSKCSATGITWSLQNLRDCRRLFEKTSLTASWDMRGLLSEERGKNLSFKACELQHGGAEVHLASLGSVLDLNIGKFCNFDLEELFWWTPASPTCEGASWEEGQHPPLGNEAINKHSIYALTTNERTNIYKGTLPQKAVEILKNMFLSFGQFIIWYTETMLFFPSYFEDKIRKKIMSITM